MKVLIATGVYPPEVGGPATYAKLLADELPKQGVDVEVFAFREVRALPKVFRHFAYFLQTIAKGRDADIIFAQDPVSVGFPSMLAAKFLRKRFVLRLGGDYAWEQGVFRYGITDDLETFVTKRAQYPFMVRVLKWVQERVARNASVIIVPSAFLKKIVAQWGVSREKITVVPNTFEAPSVPESTNALRRELSLEGNVILSAGRLVKWKGFDTLITLMPEVHKTYPDAHLYIIGEGPEREHLEALIREHGLADTVHLLGARSRETLARYVKAADVFVLNTFYEGFSHMLLEVMTLGTPIITTDAAGNPELVAHDHNGLVVSYNDDVALRREIENVLGGVRDVDAIVARAKEYATHYTVERTIQGTRACLNIL